MKNRRLVNVTLVTIHRKDYHYDNSIDSFDLDLLHINKIVDVHSSKVPHIGRIPRSRELKQTFSSNRLHDAMAPSVFPSSLRIHSSPYYSNLSIDGGIHPMVLIICCCECPIMNPPIFVELPHIISHISFAALLYST